jgi:hypothetical protein
MLHFEWGGIKQIMRRIEKNPGIRLISIEPAAEAAHEQPICPVGVRTLEVLVASFIASKTNVLTHTQETATRDTVSARRTNGMAAITTKRTIARSRRAMERRSASSGQSLARR